MLNRASFILIDSLDRDPLGTQGTLRVNAHLEFEENLTFFNLNLKSLTWDNNSFASCVLGKSRSNFKITYKLVNGCI